MREKPEDRLQKDRRHLLRALQDVQSGTIGGAQPAEFRVLEELILLRIAEIDRLLGDEPTTEA
jgi:hypothetical protein